jgi:hypothetical protein
MLLLAYFTLKFPFYVSLSFARAIPSPPILRRLEFGDPQFIAKSGGSTFLKAARHETYVDH